MSLKRILEEEAQLEKDFYGTDENLEETSTPSTSDLDDTTEDNISEEVIVSPVATEVIQQESTDDEPTEPKNRVSWKQRFINYKTATDKTISALRKENSNLVNQASVYSQKIDELSARISTIVSSKDPISEILSEEEIETIGPESVDIVKKIATKLNEVNSSPLQEEVKRLRAEKLAEEKKRAEDRQRVAYSGFLADLGRLVPDYAAINIDSKFKEFMEGYDEATGVKRVDAFRTAEDYLDADRVADFFLEFKRSVPKSKREVLEDNITPTSTGSGTNPEPKVKKDTFTAKEVEDFFNDIARGVYRNKQKEANEIEARITKAYVEGNIIG